jgi:hypothetical protein
MSGETKGAVRIVLRLEGLCVLIAASVAYAKYGFSWGTFALYFFMPDLSFCGYFAGSRVGVVCYNLAHSYIGAIVCIGAGLAFSTPMIFCAGIIWSAHIGFDRALGFGLKYANGFRFTHLGLIGSFFENTSKTVGRQDTVR